MRSSALVTRAKALLPDDATDRRCASPLPGLQVIAHRRPTSFESSLHKPAMCLFLQGRKEARFGGHRYEIGPGDCWLISHDVPVMARVKEAPSLSILFDVAEDTLRELYDELVDEVEKAPGAPTFREHRAEPSVVAALGRYLALAASPLDARVLGPAMVREIHYRLVMSPFGGMLRALVRRGGHASAVARAIAVLQRDFRKPLAIPTLARAVGMSPSLFYEQFKAITSCTPLQYQKELRLHEARRLLTTSGTSVSSAAYDVGYESPNQFSREYSRKFGVAPSRTLAERETG